MCAGNEEAILKRLLQCHNISLESKARDEDVVAALREHSSNDDTVLIAFMKGAKSLIEMGFPRDQVFKALIKANNDVQVAVSTLGT